MGKIMTALSMLKRKKSKTTSPWANVSSGDRLKSQREKIHKWTKSSPYSKGEVVRHIKRWKAGKKTSPHVEKQLEKTGKFIQKVRGDEGQASFNRQMTKHIDNLPRKSKHGRIMERKAKQQKELINYHRKKVKRGNIPVTKA